VSACIELARRLGKAIADSPQAEALRVARVELDANPDLGKTLNDYQQQAEKIEQLEEEQKPVEIEDKRRLQELNDRLVGSEVFKRFTAAQVEYIDLMRKVNEALQAELAETEG